MFKRTQRTTELLSIYIPREPTLNVVFVHGLDGDAKATWSSGSPASFLWRNWITEEREDAAVYSLSYHIKSTGWFGGSMDLTDRAVNVLTSLRYSFNYDLPTVYIVHSYGGLLVKAMLRKARSPSGRDFKWFAENTKGIVFFGTPHAGSRVSNYVLAFGKVSRSSSATRELKANSAILRDLNHWFRDAFADLDLDVVNFFETLPTRGVIVVDQSSADPGLPGNTPVPVDADHIDLPKPLLKDLRVGAVQELLLRVSTSEQTKQSDQYDLWKEVLRAKDHELPLLKSVVKQKLAEDPANRSLISAQLLIRQSMQEKAHARKHSEAERQDSKMANRGSNRAAPASGRYGVTSAFVLLLIIGGLLLIASGPDTLLEPDGGLDRLLEAPQNGGN